jgi:hypothetical protein
MHLAASGGSAITYAFAQIGAISYDYRYRIARPADKGYKYDDDCRLFIKKDGKAQYAKVRGPFHSDLAGLRKEDLTKPKLAVIRDPVSWYKSYWALNHRRNWKGNTKNPYLRNGGDKKFEMWVDNMIDDVLPSQEGFYTKYVRHFIGEPEETQTNVLRYEALAYDLHVGLEIMMENWRAASIVKSTQSKSKSADLKLSKKQLGLIDSLDSWIYQFYP